MPNWLGPLLALCGLLGFLAYALRQGTRVKKENSSDHYSGGSAGDGSHGADGGGH